MVHAQVSDKYIHLESMYMTDHIFHVIPINHLVNKYGEQTTLHELAAGKKIQYKTYVFYSVHVLYKRPLQMLTKRC